MKRKIGICIILFTAFILSVIVPDTGKTPVPTESEETQSTEESQKALAVNTLQTLTEQYVIKISDGQLVVYRAQSGEIYMETGIRADEIPADVRGELVQGIGFADEESLFEFLENYSS